MRALLAAGRREAGPMGRMLAVGPAGHPGTAYQTAGGNVRVANEALHLAGFARGHRHTVDRERRPAPQVAGSVYARLVAGSPPESAAAALNGAIRELRARGAPALVRASYVHIGP